MLKHIKSKSSKPVVGSADTTSAESDFAEKQQNTEVGSNNNGSTAGEKSSSNAEIDNNLPLPQRFVVKYLGYRETSNLWGIKYTRQPVDEMVKEAKSMLATNADKSLPLLKLEVTEGGILIGPMPQNNNPVYPSGKFAIEAISYGVQDLVYTRVFAMIVVNSALTTTSDNNESKSSSKNNTYYRLAEIQKAANGRGSCGGNEGAASSPFRCHGFVCDSRQTARKLTYSLATAFQKFSSCVAAGKVAVSKPKHFAIDLRSPEDIEAELNETEA